MNLGWGAVIVLCSNQMDRVLTLTTFEKEEAGNAALEYWLTRPAYERVEEVERLRREYTAFAKPGSHDVSLRLSRSLLLVERNQG